MKSYSKDYCFEEDEFDGVIECYLVDTSKENLKNWLEKEVGDKGTIYNIIKDKTSEVLIIKNAYIDEEFRGQGFGLDMINEALSSSYAQSSILLCDSYESQREGFKLSSFYEQLGYKTILINNEQPLMVYPEKLADEIKNQLENSFKQKKNKL